MRVRKIAGTCHDGTCPTVYITDHGTVVVQGYTVERAEGLMLADGEQAVEIPASLIKDALEGMRQ